MEPSITGNRRNIEFDNMIEIVCATAKIGLLACYAGNPRTLPYTIKLEPANAVRPEGFSVRYAAISQIGIAEWLKYHSDDKEKLPDLWPDISDNFSNITHIGDFALALWAGVAGGADNCEIFAKALSSCWPIQSKLCNTVELGWIVQACTLALLEQSYLEPHIRTVLDEAKSQLTALFKPEQNLFQRHSRSGLKWAVSRRIACFADQVYPIIALSTYGSHFNDMQSIEFAAAAADRICQLQGSLGQWWWHYDTVTSKVCEGYPVFSVHQDSMAPMAIMASDRLTGRNHLKEIKLGLQWLFRKNELSENLVLEEAGIIWRDIERREPKKAMRILRGLLCVSNLRLLDSLAAPSFLGFRINRECRPYHLGWILYAWAGYNLEDWIES